MKISYIVFAGVIGTALSGCSKANASEFDPSNPLHCATQFEVYSIIAKQQGDERTARGYGARSQWYAERARLLPAEQLTPQALTDLGNRVAAQPDGGAALAKVCWDRQDADPDFQRRVREAQAELSKGH